MKVMPPDYRHLKRMTDRVGMLQFAGLGIPDPDSGYTVDDNARALLVALRMRGDERREFALTYIRFLHSARRRDGGWCNWMLQGRLVATIDSEDSQGRAFLACCTAAGSDLEEVRDLGLSMVLQSLPVVLTLRSPRAAAYTLLGICQNPGLCGLQRGLLASAARELSSYLIFLYERCKAPGWQWFEECLTYCNGILPQALFAYYAFADDRKALRVARESLEFLLEAVFAQGYLNIVGNRGWWQKGAQIPHFDQQPVDACSIAMACLQAYAATGDSLYSSLAELAHDWYWGRNINRVNLYDAATGGCYDALVPAGVNLNQGAEALLSLLLTQQAISRLEAGARFGGCGSKFEEDGLISNL
jgi:hypothetical protein